MENIHTLIASVNRYMQQLPHGLHTSLGEHFLYKSIQTQFLFYSLSIMLPIHAIIVRFAGQSIESLVMQNGRLPTLNPPITWGRHVQNHPAGVEKDQLVREGGKGGWNENFRIDGVGCKRASIYFWGNVHNNRARLCFCLESLLKRQRAIRNSGGRIDLATQRAFRLIEALFDVTHAFLFVYPQLQREICVTLGLRNTASLYDILINYWDQRNYQTKNHVSSVAQFQVYSWIWVCQIRNSSFALHMMGFMKKILLISFTIY